MPLAAQAPRALRAVPSKRDPLYSDGTGVVFGPGLPGGRCAAKAAEPALFSPSPVSISGSNAAGGKSTPSPTAAPSRAMILPVFRR